MASRARAKKVYVESVFQKAIRRLTFEEFCDKTNIHGIVQDGYRKAAEEKNLPIAVMSGTQMNQYAKHYYDRLHKLHLWHKSGLKNLKWRPVVSQSEILPAISDAASKVSEVTSIAGSRKRCHPEENLKNANGEKTRAEKKHNAEISIKASKVSVAPTVTNNNLALSREIDDATISMSDTLDFEKLSFQSDRDRPIAIIFEPNEFQAEIIAMNFDEFVAETNIEEIVRKELQHRSETIKRPATADQIDARIKLYYEKRYCVDEWWPCGLKHLKYKLCECKRNRPSTVEAMVQSDVRPQQDACTQFESDIEFIVPGGEHASDGVVVLPEEPARVSQSTQTEEPQENAGNPMADPSRQSGPQHVPEAERPQQFVEPLSVDENNRSVNGINVGHVVTEEVQNGETVEPDKFDDSSEDAHVIAANENNEMICGHCESGPAMTQPAQQPVSISDTNELNTENMFRELTGEWVDDTGISVRSVDSTPTEMEREMREAMHKRHASVMEFNVICALDTENTNPNRREKPCPKSKKRAYTMAFNDVMIPSFKLSVATEHPINENGQATTILSKLTPSLNDILNARSILLSTPLPEDGDEYVAEAALPFNADAENQKMLLSGSKSSSPDDFFLPESKPVEKSSNVVPNSKTKTLEESNSNSKVVVPPMKKLKLIEVEHSHATGASSILRTESEMPLDSAMSTVPRQQYEAFIFKIPQSNHHEFLYHLNVECTFRRLRVDAITSKAAIANCHKQMHLQKTLRLKSKSLHRVTLQGECPKMLCQLKCSSWKDVQILLEIVKNFAYNMSVSQPPPMSILGRVLYHFFVKTSKFTSVYIQNVQNDSRVMSTSFGLNPNGKRARTPNDPFYLDSFNYDSKRLKKE